MLLAPLYISDPPRAARFRARHLSVLQSAIYSAGGQATPLGGRLTEGVFRGKNWSDCRGGAARKGGQGRLAVWDTIYICVGNVLGRAALVFAAVSGSVLLAHTIMSRCRCRNSKKQQRLYSHTHLLQGAWINGGCDRRHTLHRRHTHVTLLAR